MDDSRKEWGEGTSVRHNATVSCLMTRLIPLGVGIMVIVLTMGVLLATAVTFLLGHEVDPGLSWADLALLLPLSLAMIAWRWHLAGGILIVLLTCAGLVYAWFNREWGIDEYSFLFNYLCLAVIALLFFTGGILHLVVWWKQRKQGAA